MKARELDISGAWVFEPNVFPDARGSFTAPFQGPAFRAALGFEMTVKQTNQSLSRRGAVRGIHYADVPPGQAKYLYVAAGAILDVIVDLRVDSPTFGSYEVVELDAESMQAVYLSEGLGHAFQALQNGTVVGYLCSEPYNPAAEHGICPDDPELAIPWVNGVEPIMSDKDRGAPTLAKALENGALPNWEECQRFYKRGRA